jgi:hypothetical protein
MTFNDKKIFRHQSPQNKRDGGLNLISFGAGMVLFIAARELIVWLVKLLRLAGPLYWLGSPVGVSVLLVGFACFKFREKKPTQYGFLEIGVGYMMGAQSALKAFREPTSADVSMVTVFGLLSGAYLVVQGLDNATQQQRELRAAEKLQAQTKQLIAESIRSVASKLRRHGPMSTPPGSPRPARPCRLRTSPRANRAMPAGARRDRAPSRCGRGCPRVVVKGLR